MKLKTVGYWATPELPGPDPTRMTDSAWRTEERARIARYLRTAAEAVTYLGYSYCRFGECVPDETMGCRDLTDGVYIWPEGLAHYIECHGVTLPHEFVEHMRRSNFVPPREVAVADPFARDATPWLAYSKEVGAFSPTPIARADEGR